MYGRVESEILTLQFTTVYMTCVYKELKIIRLRHAEHVES